MVKGGISQGCDLRLALSVLLLLSLPSILVDADGTLLPRSQSNTLRLRGGVGAPADVGARGYANSPPFPLQYGARRPDAEKKPELHEIVVPDTLSTLSEAVAAIESEHTVKIRRGDQRWDGLHALPLTSNVTANFLGEQGTRLLGRWLLPACPVFCSTSRGSFQSVTCAYATDDYLNGGDWELEGEEGDGNPHALLVVMGGPWQFGKCELRAASAEAVVGVWRAQMALQGCEVGGMGTLQQLNGSMAACTGIHIGSQAMCEVRETTVEMCGNWGGSGVRAVEEGRVLVKESKIRNCALGLSVNDAARVECETVDFKGNDLTHLFAGDNASYAGLRLQNATFHEGLEQEQAPVWLSPVRPGVLHEDGTVIVPGFSLKKKKFNFLENPDIPEEEWETHPDLIRLDRLNEMAKAQERENSRGQFRLL